MAGNMKKALLMITLYLSAQMTALAQTPIPLWEGEPPFNLPGVTVEEFVEDGRVSKVSHPELAHYPAAGGGAPRPAVVILPGGGYARQSTLFEGTMAAQWFNEQGIEAFVLKYRLPDEEIVSQPAFVPLLDARQAIALVRARAAEFGVDPARVGIIGFSAGGHLAASASTLYALEVPGAPTPAQARPDFSILVYPVITMDGRFTHRGSRRNLIGELPSPAHLALFSLENQVSAQTPMTLLVHALDDRAVPVENSDAYAANLHAAGGDVTKLILPVGGHGFGFKPDSPVPYWTQYLAVWLRAKGLAPSFF